MLLSNPGAKARRAYGIPKTLGLVDARATFVIDAPGVVRMAYAAQLVAEGHATRALETVRALPRSPLAEPAAEFSSSRIPGAGGGCGRVASADWPRGGEG